ncbi:MAG TPA: iron export ABC transporter permease subunit FetB [Caldilineae bacterium]|nr:iron export ABC transporter permease subunit FetB [Caldilineae bacterium]
MLNQFFHDPLSLGVAQAIVATVMALVVMLIAHFARIHLEREILIALARAFVQVLAVGSVLLLIFEGPVVVGFLILGLMMLLAAQTASRRAQGMPQAFRVSLTGIVLGAGPVIVLMAWMGVIDTKLTVLIPVGSMIVANSMTTTSLALDRFRGEISSHVGHIDAALALGATPKAAVAPYTRAAVRASLIPRIDSLSSLGIVWIPGVMTGMLLAGSQPIDAALYQFVVMAMIFTVSGLASLISASLMSARVFSPAEQLVLRTGKGKR